MNRRKLLALIVASVAYVVLLAFMLSGGRPVLADVLYVIDTSIADFNQGTLFHVELEPIDDGSVALQSVGLAGGWSDTTTTGLPPRFYQASTHVGNYIYVCGGTATSTPLADCYVSTIQVGNGHQLSAWRSVSTLPEALLGPSAVAVTVGGANYVYVIGGLSGNSGFASNRTYRATVNMADGSLSAWTLDAQTLTIALDHLGATVVNGYIYVIGGERNAPPNSARSFFSHPAANGSLTAWTETTSLPGVFTSGVTGHIVTSYADKVFLGTGTVSGGGAVPDVYNATANPDGTLGTWVQNTNYQRNLTFAAATTYGTQTCGANLFLSGGTTNQGQQATDYVAAAGLSLPDYIASNWYDSSQLVTARYGHTMIASDDGWLYVIDGTLAGSQPLNSIRFGETACAAQGGATRAASGQFTSRLLDLVNATTIYSLTWNTSMTPSVPISLSIAYRLGNALPLTSSFSSPITIGPGISQTASIPISSTARYLQYRVTFARDDSALVSTPRLNWVRVSYEGNPPPPPTPTGTPGLGGADLVTSAIEMVPYGGYRPSLDHKVQFNISVLNIGTRPASGHLEVDAYIHLNRPPVPGDPSDAFGSTDITALQPGGQIIVTTYPISATNAGPLTMYGWANRNGYIAELNTTNNILGPLPSCIYAHDGQSFSDVPTSQYFYRPVEYLACRGVISGYTDGTFRPFANTTRGQFAKMDSLAVGWPIVTPAAGGHTFADVPTTFPFFPFVETAAAHGVISGYLCGGSGEPCDSQHRPYFRPYANITRGQLAKIIALSKGWPLMSPSRATFSDVPVGSPFFSFVETVYRKGVVSGYNCGTNCLQYRPGNNGTRGQLSKMLYIAVTQQ